MQLFLCTSNVEQVVKYSGLGVISGIYLHPAELPSLDQHNAVRRLAAETGLIFCRVDGDNAESLMKEGQSLARYSSKLALTLPFHGDSLKVARMVKPLGIVTCIGPVRSAEHGLLALLSGAEYLLLNAFGNETGHIVSILSEITAKNHFATKLLVQPDTPAELLEFVQLGAHGAFLSFSLFEQMLR